VTLTLTAQGSSTTRDSVRLRCAPLIYVDNTRPAERVYAMRFASGQGANLPFWNALQSGLTGQGVPLQEVRADRYQYDRWVQDGMQLGYQSYVGASGQQVWIDDFNQLERGRGLGPLVPRELLGPNRGMAYGGRGVDDSVNYGGNLEVVPPHSANGKDYPFGRIYIGGGNSTVLGAPLNRHMNREEQALLNAQQVQGPVIELSSEWLAVGHVDEFSQPIPNRSGSGRAWKMAWASPALGRSALRDLQARGLGATRVFRGRPSETTVDRTCGLTAADFVELPTLFEDIGYDGEDMGVALNPGVANCITVNDTLYVPDPEGPREGALDVWQEQVLAATRPLGLRVVFVDVFESYHEMLGESHCGSNVRYRPYDTPWWTR
jgi:protein-arginine deiminase